MKIIPILTAIFILTSSFLLSADGIERSSAKLFYTNLTDSVDTASGNALVNFHSGRYQTNYGGYKLKWDIDPKTYATIVFQYAQGKVHYADVQFKRKPLHLVCQAPVTFEAYINRIEYDETGHFTDKTDIKIVSSAPGADDTIMLEKQLRLNRGFNDLALGRLFACDSNENTAIKIGIAEWDSSGPTHIISSVELLTIDQAALALTLKPDSTIYFSPGGTSHVVENFIVTGQGCSVVLNDTTFDLDTGSVNGSLEKFHVNGNRGRISTGDTKLDLAEGFSLDFVHLNFSGDNKGNAQLSGDGGSLAGKLSVDSVVEINRNSIRPTWLVVDGAGADIVLMRLSLSLTDGKAVSFSVGAGSQFSMAVKDSRLGLGNNNFVNITTGHVKCDLKGTWSSVDEPDIEGEIADLDVNLGSGTFGVRPLSNFDISGGEIKASRLIVNTSNRVPISGKFSAISLELKGETILDFNGILKLACAPGGKLVCDDPAYPFELCNNGNSVVGNFHIDVPFRTLLCGTNSPITLFNGKVGLDFDSMPDGTIHTRDTKRGELSGQVAVVGANMNSPLTGVISYSNLALAFSPQTGLSISGTASASVSPGFSVPLTSPFERNIPDHDDMRIFPMSVSVGVANAVIIPPAPLKISGSGISFHDSVHIDAVVSILPGFGQYDNENNPTKPHHNGHDQTDTLQEVFRDTYLGGSSTVHLYLVPDTIPTSADITVDINGRGLEISLSHISLSKRVKVIKDGGDLSKILAAIGAIVGGTIAGPFGAAVVGTVGFVEGDSLEDQITNLASEAISKAAENYRGTWHAALPQETLASH